MGLVWINQESKMLGLGQIAQYLFGQYLSLEFVGPIGVIEYLAH